MRWAPAGRPTGGVALERMRQEGARITTVESLLFELTERSGTETFREILRLVK